MAEETTAIRAGEVSCEKTRKLKILKSLHKLIHACKCTDLNCEEIGCDEMKSLVIHFKVCTKKRKEKECHLCKQLISLCLYHAKNSKDCESVHCVVPYCAKIKFKLNLKKGLLPEGSKSRQNANYDDNLEKGVHPEEAQSWDSAGSSGSNLGQNSQDDALAAPIDASFSRSGDAEHSPQAGHLSAPPPPYPRVPATEAIISTSNNPRPDICPSELRGVENQSLLKKLLHAHKCLSEEEHGVAGWPCFETNCGEMKAIIRHIFQCSADPECSLSHCSTYKRLLNHWGSCKDRRCSLCGPTMASHPTDTRTFSFPINGIPNPWKREVYQRMRWEIVDYAIAIVLARRTLNYEGGADLFVKRVEAYAYSTASSKTDYCRCIAQRLFYTNGNENLEFEVEDIGRLFQGILSLCSLEKEQTTLNFLQRHPRVMATFMKRRMGSIFSSNLPQF